ncbi:hypothetical protein RchiOBHm_Chr2g0143891 [Rosa chinensis]|uniref:Uncharacterized protein n=1 Tax=Rosa chinensis TaxID=74649 RepID=A0A2P6RYA7_ROSCH|nr:hypothetical protein RchiOBHm_Chr2g0143891 [Rosa chinensis]
MFRVNILKNTSSGLLKMVLSIIYGQKQMMISKVCRLSLSTQSKILEKMTVYFV